MGCLQNSQGQIWGAAKAGRWADSQLLGRSKGVNTGESMDAVTLPERHRQPTKTSLLLPIIVFWDIYHLSSQTQHAWQNPKIVGSLASPPEETEGKVGRSTITREPYGIPTDIMTCYPSISWDLTGSFFFPQKQQEAIIKFKYAAYDRGESSVTSGIITMESEMKNIEKTNI